MANEKENTTEKFTGFRYLMDAESSRQYALEYDEGVPKFPLYVFNPGNRNDKLLPGETVFALDDEQTSDTGSVTAEAYKITATRADAKGQHCDFETAFVTYTSAPAAAGDVKFDMTPEAREALVDPAENTDLTGFPLRFSGPAGDVTLPPHHAGGKATLARDGIKALIAAGKIKPRKVVVLKDEFPIPPVAPRMPSRISDAKIEDALAKYGRDLTADAKAGRLDPIVGRDEEIENALEVLNRREMGSLCFTGDAGCGKSAMFSGIAHRLVSDRDSMPEDLRDARVILLDLQSMNAGTKFRGEFEERIKPLLEGIAERGGKFRGQKIIFAIDELHSQLTAGAAEGGSNAGEMMKPYLVTEGCSIVGTCTDDEYTLFIEKNKALARRFERAPVNSPGETATIAMLKKSWPYIKRHNHLTENPTNKMLEYIYTMCSRYAPQEAHPSKDKKVLLMAASRAEMKGRTGIDESDIVNAVAHMSKLSPEFLAQNDSERFLRLEEDLEKVVVGQPGLPRITDGLIGARAGLTNPDQPWGCFVMQGPSGVGKTETCKALARALFGDDQKALIQLNMSDYQQEHDVSKITGAPPGYIGFNEPSLTERVRQQPYCILLLDELEKAHSKVFDKFLAILQDGKISDNHNRTVLFNNVIIVMTTNLGADRVQKLLDAKGKPGMSMGSRAELSPEKLQAEMEKIYVESSKKVNGGPFRPEMLNRINMLGGFITYIPLSEDAVARIAKTEISRINKRLSNADGLNLTDVTLEVSESVMQQICKEGYNPSMGARPLQSVVRKKVIDPLSKWLLSHKDEVAAFVEQEGPAKLVINSLELSEKGRPVVTPVLTRAEETPVVVNDNVPETKTLARRRTAANGPSQP